MPDFPVTVTDQAAARLLAWLERKAEPGSLVRIGVKGGGCNGLEYVIKFESVQKEGDLLLELGGLKIVCDPKSATYLDGAILQWTGNLAGAFRFDNPNADRSCGCGTSFSLKKK